MLIEQATVCGYTDQLCGYIPNLVVIYPGLYSYILDLLYKGDICNYELKVDSNGGGGYLGLFVIGEILFFVMREF